jgi:hypothetical protein
MFTRRQSAKDPTWSVAKLRVLLLGLSVVAVFLVVGLGAAIYHGLHTTKAAAHGGLTQPTASAGNNAAPTSVAHATGGTAGVPSGTTPPATASPTVLTAASAQVAESALAARPMVTLDPTAAQPAAVSTADPGSPLLLSPAIGVGPAGVPTGYPHTPLGALAQLAALDQAALASGSLEGVRAVIGGWAAPGGPTRASWSGVAAMAQFLNAAHLSGGGSAQLALVVTPLMGQIKGTVGPDFVVPCVDFEVDATLKSTARVGLADCERMVWSAGRWIIGPGHEPADPASVWPDTDAAISAGWRDVRRG